MKRFLFIFIPALFFSPIYLTEAANLLPSTNIQGLLAHWSFDSSSENTTFYDMTGNGFDATCSKALNTQPGVKGNALHFPGSVYELIAANSAADFNLPEFTIEVLFYTDVDLSQLPDEAYIFNQQYIVSGVRNGYGLKMHQDGRVDFGMATSDGGSYVEVESKTKIQPNRWYHITATFDAAGLKVYVNGAFEGSAPYAGMYPPSTADARIGCQRLQDGTLRCFNIGKFDELKLYNCALNADSIHAHFVLYNLPEEMPQTLIAHWSFDDSSGNTYYDVTGNGYDATSSGLSLAPGVKGMALNCPGGGYELIVKNSKESFNFVHFTIETWFYSNIDIDLENTFAKLFDYQHINSGIQNGYSIHIDAEGKVVFSFGNSEVGWITAVSNTTIKPKRWYHIVCLYDGTYLKEYIDGVLDNKTQYSGSMYAPPHADARIGCQTLTDGTVRYPIDGKLDEMKLYDYALSADTIQFHYNSLKPIEEPSLEINLGMKTTYAQAGDTVVMPVYIANHEEIMMSALQLKLLYNPAEVELLSITKDSGLVNKWELFDWGSATAGSIPVAMGGTSTKLGYGEGELFRCVFRVDPSIMQKDTCVIKLTDIVIDEQSAIILTSQDGHIIIDQKSILYGDVTGNNEVNIFDAQKVLSYVVGTISLPDVCCPNFTLAVADVSGNGAITSYDAALICQYSMGLIPSFPVEVKQSKALSKRGGISPQKGYLTMVRKNKKESEDTWDLVGTNLRGFYAGEFAIKCDVPPEQISQSLTSTEIRGATLSSKFIANDKILKVAVISNDDIDNDSGITIVRITLPPSSQQSAPSFAIQAALINEGAIMTDFPNMGLVSSGAAMVASIPHQAAIRLVNKTLKIIGIGDKPAAIVIWDLNGKRIEQRTLSSAESSFDLNRLSGGAYIYRIKNGSCAMTGKIILTQ